MSGITKCRNEECQLSASCYRVTAKTSEYHQSYADFRPTRTKGITRCEFYIDKKQRW